ncbi:response regulator [Acidimangrovimonas sediminis]|uniref:response regulator n=1 Tax=Acidimangrovimonas sediminis TaxID=2056283 RepID=UPI000C802933|nr:response regulator transcription factor [Acidimangrovimonas sediminis]
MRILLVEDDPALGQAVREHIAALGHGVDLCPTLADAEAALDTVAYEMAVLDLGLPDGSGLDLLRRLRRRGGTLPVIIVTAVDQIARRIEGLNSGADDYIVKPFDLDELGARIASVQRRYRGNPSPLIRVAGAEIDLARRIVSRDDARVDLTAREWAVLERLLRHPGGVVAKAEIEDSLYAFGAEIESNAVEVYISRLRKKLGHAAIVTLRGAGYRLEV